MRASTINHIRERIAHANQQHGEFASADHIIAAAGIELMEATVAAHYAGDVVHELLDGAVVLIRGAEQLGGIEGCFYDPAEEVAQFIYGHHGQQRIEEATRIMSYLAAHAVIDIPADVPSAEELAKLICATPDENGNLPRSWKCLPKWEKQFRIRGCSAILAHLAPWLQPRTVTEEQIEKAARGLYENYEIWSWGRAGNWVKESDVCRNLWKDRAIATFEAAGFSVEGQSDAAV